MLTPMRASILALVLAVVSPIVGVAAFGFPTKLSAQARNASAPSVSGIWDFEVVTENGTGFPTVQLIQMADSLSGFYNSDRMGSRPLVGVARGDSIVFQLATDPSAGVIMTFSGIVRSDGTLAGIVDFGGMGGATFTARRQPVFRARRSVRPAGFVKSATFVRSETSVGVGSEGRHPEGVQHV